METVVKEKKVKEKKAPAERKAPIERKTAEQKIMELVNKSIKGELISANSLKRILADLKKSYNAIYKLGEKLGYITEDCKKIS